MQCQCLAKSAYPGTERLPEEQKYAGYVKEQSVSAYESLDAGLTIKTREGDVVTLSSSSFAKMDSYLYDSKGVLTTESGTAVASQSYREITLESGEQFSFSVSGDLSESELADIEDIVKNIDKIISEMAQGDMEEAVSTALSMGGYDTVSAYSADITYQKTYAAQTQVQAETLTDVPEAQILPTQEEAIPSVSEPFPENRVPRKKNKNSIQNINQFVEKMAEKIEKYDEKVLSQAQKPVDKLFRKHMADESEKGKSGEAHYNVLDASRRKISNMIERMVQGIFEGMLASSSDTSE